MREVYLIGLITVLIFCFNKSLVYQLAGEEYSDRGILYKSNEEIYFKSDLTQEVVQLEFVYKESDFIIEDMSNVEISGYYLKMTNRLLVESIYTYQEVVWVNDSK